MEQRARLCRARRREAQTWSHVVPKGRQTEQLLVDLFVRLSYTFCTLFTWDLLLSLYLSTFYLNVCKWISVPCFQSALSKSCWCLSFVRAWVPWGVESLVGSSSPCWTPTVCNRRAGFVFSFDLIQWVSKRLNHFLVLREGSSGHQLMVRPDTLIPWVNHTVIAYLIKRCRKQHRMHSGELSTKCI